jgi:hypothetical protein
MSDFTVDNHVARNFSRRVSHSPLLRMVRKTSICARSSISAPQALSLAAS